MIPSRFPIPRKATRIARKAHVFTDATPDDADFILEIRTDQHKGRRMSTTSPVVERQRRWLNAHAGSFMDFKLSHFDVQKGNPKVGPLSERFCFVRTGRAGQDYLYKIGMAAMNNSSIQRMKLLPGKLKVGLN